MTVENPTRKRLERDGSGEGGAEQTADGELVASASLSCQRDCG